MMPGLVNPYHTSVMQLLAAQDQRLILLEKQFQQNQHNIFANCLNCIQSLTSSIQQLTVETSMLKLKMGFQYNPNNDFFKILKNINQTFQVPDLNKQKTLNLHSEECIINPPGRKRSRLSQDNDLPSLSSLDKNDANDLEKESVNFSNANGQVDENNVKHEKFSIISDDDIELEQINFGEITSKTDQKTDTETLQEISKLTENILVDEDKISENENLETLVSRLETGFSDNLEMNAQDLQINYGEEESSRLSIEDEDVEDKNVDLPSSGDVAEDGDEGQFFDPKTNRVIQQAIDLKQMTELVRNAGRHEDNYFYCPIDSCSYGSRFLTRVRLHLLTHSVQKSYGCNLCDIRYKVYRELRSHYTRKHGKQLKKTDVLFYRPNSSEGINLDDCHPDEYVT